LYILGRGCVETIGESRSAQKVIKNCALFSPLCLGTSIQFYRAVGKWFHCKLSTWQT